MNFFKKSGFVALILDDESVIKLKKEFPPRYEKIFYHHVTLEYKPSVITYFFKYKKLLDKDMEIKATHIIYDEKAEALIVDCDLSKNNIPHISLSAVIEKRAAYSNEMLRNLLELKDNMREVNLAISGRVKFIKR